MYLRTLDAKTVLLLSEAWRSFSKFIDALRGVRLRQLGVELLASLSTQRFEVRTLSICHRLAAGFPFIRITLERRLSGIIR